MHYILKLDAFSKIPEELTNATWHGAYLTIITYTIMSLLFFVEYHSYLTPSAIKTVELDSHYAQYIWIDFDVVMHELPCKYTNVVVRDIVGQQQLDTLNQRITKERIDASSGNFKGIHTDNNNMNNNMNNNNRDIRHSHNDQHWIKTSDEFKHTHFDAVIKYHDFTFIIFYAEWCIHCTPFVPTWIEAENKANSITFGDKNRMEVVAKLLHINCVSFQDLCARIGIRAYPTVRMYKRNGTFVVYHGQRKIDSILDFFSKFVESEAFQVELEMVSHHNVIEEGCRVHGQLKVGRVPGCFLLESDSSIDSLEPAMTNVSHRVNHFLFLDDGEAFKNYAKNTAHHATKDILKNVEPMRSTEFISFKAHMAPQHYLNVIPTIYDETIIVYQSTVQSHIADVKITDIPQVRFSYQFFPMTIKVSTAGRPFYDFLTSVFAIVGGTYAFLSLVDRFWYTMRKKTRKPLMRFQL